MKKTKKLCMVAMLIAVTVVLGYISGFLRIGGAIKFSISFITVYLAGAVFGPVIGGFVGIASDFLSYIFNPTGAYLLSFGIIEFIYGALFGIFFYKKAYTESKRLVTALKIVLCIGIQLAINVFIKTYILMKMGFLPSPSYFGAICVRLPACLVMAAVQIAVIAVMEKLAPVYIKIAGGETK